MSKKIEFSLSFRNFDVENDPNGWTDDIQYHLDRICKGIRGVEKYNLSIKHEYILDSVWCELDHYIDINVTLEVHKSIKDLDFKTFITSLLFDKVNELKEYA